MGSKSREVLYGHAIRWAAAEAAEARKKADLLACVGWNKRMLGYGGPAQPSPTIGDAINARMIYLEIRCNGCDTHQTLALDALRVPRSWPVHRLEGRLSCKLCCERMRRRSYNSNRLVALRGTKICTENGPSYWYPPGER